MSETMTGGRCLAEMLNGYGVTHVFFVDAILRKMMIELEDFGIKRVLTHSEKAASYMADGYARVSGRVGVCLSQSVGAANLASGLQDPYLAHSPVIAITGSHTPQLQYKNAYQELDHAPLFAAVTKMHARIDTPEQLAPLLRQAFRTATTGTPRPVHLDITNHTGDVIASARHAHDTTVEAEYGRFPALRPQPEPAAVERAAAAIKASARPVIIADRGATIADARVELQALAKRINAPLICSPDAKGLVLEDDPLYGGAIGTYGSSSANTIAYEADLVIFAGSNTSDMNTAAWRTPKPGVKVIHIDMDPTELGRNYPGTIGIHADVKAGLAALAAAAPVGKRKAWLDTAKGHVEAWKAMLANEPAPDHPLRPNRLCRELTEVLPKDAIVFSDTGWSAQWSANMIGIRHATQSYHRAAGSLGWSTVAAMGAKAGAPDRPVVVFTGDGGFFYHALELETACRWGLNIVVVVNNNGGLGQGVRNINATYANRPGRKEELYQFNPVSYAKLAEVLGAHGQTVERASDFAKAFQTALTCGKPAVIDCKTEFGAAAPDPWVPA